MDRAMKREEVFAAMRALVADSLALAQEDVKRESRLVTDLGADSLDFLDMTFAIEKEFGIKLREGELDFLSRLDFSSPEVMREGHLTPDAVEKLAAWLPALRELPDRERVTPGQLFSLITVETLCIMVEGRLRLRQ